MPSNQQLLPAAEKDLRRKLIQTSVVLLIMLASGILFVVIKTGRDNPGAALLWAFACFVVGCIGGFLFGLPRTPRTDNTSLAGSTSKTSAQPAPANNLGEDPTTTVFERKSVTLREESGSGLGINTNLQDISDWLTKMIVGIGLVELRSIPRYMVRLGDYVGEGIGVGMQSTASSIVIYFTGFGFLSSYLLTRMFVSPAFLLADKATQSGIAYETAQTALALAELNGEVNGALDVLRRTDLQTPARMDHLISVLSGYRAQFPLNRRLHIVLGRLYRVRKNDLSSAIRVLEEFVRRKRKAGETDDIDVADALFNIACYYSLQLKDAASTKEKELLERKGSTAIRESIDMCPENIEGFNEDDDLGALRNSESGRKILEKT